MITFPNAKINLGLNVLQRRKDGYHDISTVIVPIALTDVLEIIPSDSDDAGFSRSGLPVPGNTSDDLCLKAYHMMKEKTGKKEGAVIHLHKVIPPGSGLGGGSSDAAGTLLMLNELFRAGMNMAGKLGSDCPYFIQNKPAIATGRGDVLREISVNLRDKVIFIVMPGIHISTNWAYSLIVPRPTKLSLDEVVSKDVTEWKEMLVNDFERHVFSWYPHLRTFRDRLYQAGALYASMSGSGSAVYGIFEKKVENLEKDFQGLMTFRCLPLAG